MYQSRAVRALVKIHDQQMRSFLAVWKDAGLKQLELPPSQNKDYQSLDTLLRHVLKAARGYLVWIADSLQLPAPELTEPPEAVATQADENVDELLSAWGQCLTEVQQNQLSGRRYHGRRMEMSILEMLEHAVVHPQRHEFQLHEMLADT